LQKLHYIYGYQERDLKSMFHISVLSVRKLLSPKYVNSPERLEELAMLAKHTEAKKKIISTTEELIRTKRGRISIPQL